MRAKRRDGNQREIFDALCKAGYFVRDLASHGNGIPDLLATSKSHVDCFLECKMPGEKLTEMERLFFELHPGKHFIVRSAEEALDYMADLDGYAVEVA
jgi:hypothetical protein